MSEFLQQTINGLTWGGIYALIALGYTMVYGVLRLINFAHGDIYMIGAMTGYYAARWLGGTTSEGSAGKLLAVVAISMAVCGALGVVIERVAYRPLRNAPRVALLITAIGVSLLLEYGGQKLFGADPKFFSQIIPSRPLLQTQGLVINNIQTIILVLCFVLMAALYLIVQHTKIGKAMRAISFSQAAGRFVGIPIDRVVSITFFIGSSLAGAAGVLVSLANPKIDPLMGIMPGLKAFIAAVLGGIGNIPGALAGGLILGLTETFVTAYISSTYRDALAFLILILILLLRPAGLFGKAVKEKV